MSFNKTEGRAKMKKKEEVKHQYDCYYIKLKNGKYKQCGYGDMPDIYNGLWLIDNGSYKNVMYHVGDLPDPVNIANYIKLMRLEDCIVNAIKTFPSKPMSLYDRAKHITDCMYKDLEEWNKTKKKPEYYRRW